MRYHERKAKLSGFKFVAGVDEVGRGTLAGPVVSCAVHLKKMRFKNRIDDSKKLSRKARTLAYHELIKHCDFGIGIVNEKAIDHINILEASKISMQRALANLSVRADFLLIDGNMDLEVDIPSKKIIGGDSKSITIAAASIIAKVIRDRIMELYHKVYPKYGFKFHKGYATKTHLAAIRKFGPCSIHRLSFRPLSR
ncbi:MAG: ribonuclease HII [Candidatus Omnitrophica bacterium]|nr:ribonuclease HII [Candidatus Omnitrophota bacterium]